MRLALAALFSVLFAASGRAAEAGRCDGYGDLASHPELGLARVAGAGRAPFVRNPEGADGCPNSTDACRDRAYLVPGDQVIAGAVAGAYTCVDYVNAEGDDRAGWMETARLAREPAPPVAPADWTGTWVRTEARVVIRPGAGGRLKVDGDATYGALDPDRVKRGAVNIGAFGAEVAPDGPTLAFDVGDKATLPVAAGDAADCKVWMRRLGPHLLVDDNNQCGGFNVSFRGVYRRKT